MKDSDNFELDLASSDRAWLPTDLRLSESDLPRLPPDVRDILDTRLNGPKKLARILADLTSKFIAMDRYERRALSRSKFAIRSFDALLRKDSRLSSG